MRNNNKFTWMLIVLVVGLWSTIAFRIYDATTSYTIKDAAVQSSPEFSKTQDLRSYTYVANVRDPFLFVSRTRKDTLSKIIATRQRPHWLPPPMTLTGILLTGKKKTATVEGPDGVVFFLHEGDTLSEVKVLKIRSQSVTYYYHKKKAGLVIEK